MIHLAETTGTSDSGGWWFVVLILVAAVVIALAVLFIAALVSILRTRTLTVGGKVLWVIAAFVFPVLGPLVWFLWGRGAQLSRGPYRGPYRDPYAPTDTNWRAPGSGRF